ncbi:MAG: ABC transporter ATP-binding protein [Elusimicrobia bacterium]|nr:ABC transporter ATP-binding protein [Elusimicrobiota bacterium]
MSARSWRLGETMGILRSCSLSTRRMWTYVAAYYVLIPLSAVLDGASWLMLVRVFTFEGSPLASGASPGSIDPWLQRLGLPLDPAFLLKTTIAVFAARVAVTIGLSTLEGVIQALIRQGVQEACFANLMQGRWDAMRAEHVGRWVGSLTEEAAAFAKFVVSALRAVYALAAFLILAAMAFVVEPRMTLLMAAVGLPAWAALKYTYAWQIALSRRLVQSRQGFIADITERLEGLFQIKAAGETEPYLKSGIRRQGEMTSAEIDSAWLGGVLTAFNAILMCCVLAAYYAVETLRGSGVTGRIRLLGSVGILGFRAISQLNYLIAALGTLTRLTGSVDPVLKLLAIPPERAKRPLPEPLAAIRLESVGYGFEGRAVLKGRDLSIPGKTTFLITGPSGSGKTTLANLISGIYEPAEGVILYVGASGKEYDSRRFHPRIGYVTQDVRLFRGTVRDNLDPWGKLSDSELWKHLADADAAQFVQKLGGLDAEVAEAGRSFSGGEKRRLAIARALAQRSDCLVLDEVTNGLDTENKRGLLETIGRLGSQVLIVAIAHDVATYAAIDKTLFELVPLEGRDA